MLRSIRDKHTCKCDEKEKNTMAHVRWVANEVKNKIRNHKDFKPNDLQLEICDKHGYKISYSTSYTSKFMCHERIWESDADGYRMCSKIANQLLKNNPGSLVQRLKNPVDNSFVFLCVIFKASLDGFVNECKPYHWVRWFISEGEV